VGGMGRTALLTKFFEKDRARSNPRDPRTGTAPSPPSARQTCKKEVDREVEREVVLFLLDSRDPVKNAQSLMGRAFSECSESQNRTDDTRFFRSAE
jgi:hypothetical protein